MRPISTSMLCLLFALTGACAPDQDDETTSEQTPATRDQKALEDGTRDAPAETTPQAPGSNDQVGRPGGGSKQDDDGVTSGPVAPPVDCSHVPNTRDGKCEDQTGCRFFDPDCRDQARPATPVLPATPVVCTQIFKLADGVCDPNDPCPQQDEDCVSEPEPFACPAIGYLTNGRCEAPKGCESNDPVDCKV